MLKRSVSIPLVIAGLSSLIWLFRYDIAEIAQFLWNDDILTGKIKNWTAIIAAPFTVISGAVALFNFLRKPTEPNQLLSNYYQKLHKTCELIDLSLVDVKFTEFARSVKNNITLPVVYQEMDVLPYRSERDNSEEAESKMHLRGQERKPSLLACAEDQYQRVVLLGDSGAGKSMFMDNLAWLVSGSHLGETDKRLPAVFRRLPLVRVRLRSAALLGKNQGFGRDLLLQAMQREIADLMGDKTSGEALWQALKTPLLEHGLILLDGLDEVPETDCMRAHMLDAIDDLVKELGPEARLIVTSRPYVFEDGQSGWLDAFASLALQPMSNEQIERFINHWYALLRATRGYSEAVAQQNAHQLFADLRDRDYLLEPARRPLILTLLTSLHFASGILPHSRAELYREAIALMLERWTQRSHRENPDYPLEDYERKALAESAATRQIALQKLAMDAHRKKTLQIPETQIKGLFADYVSSDSNPTNLLDFIRYRSGILRPGQGNTFEFYHRSFQDYLAALDITEQPDWQDVMNRLLREEGQDWWGGVFLLLVSAKVAGNSKPDAVALLLRYVPETLDYAADQPEKWQWLFLAARATIEQQKPLANYSNPQYADLQNWLTCHLRALVEQGHDYGLPIKLRAEAGRLLGELGDPRPGVGCIKDETGKPRLFNGVKLPGIVWESIPAGEFRMGTDGDEGYADEKPAHTVPVHAFKISRYPVTNAQFACFVEAGGYKDERWWLEPPAALAWWKGEKADLSLLDDNPEWKKSYENWLAQEKTRRQPWFWEQRKWNNPNHPVVGVSWYEALAFCRWLNDSGQFPGMIRLPSEAEWEYAARGSEGWRYAWGKEADAEKGNYRDTGLERTSAVGLFPPGKAFAGIALYDMSGNVWEWTCSQWGKQVGSPDFSYKTWAGQETLRDDPNVHALRIIRGGSWYVDSGDVRCAVRDRYRPIARSDDVGFRLVCVEVLPGSEY